MKNKRLFMILGVLGVIIISIFAAGYYLNEQFNERIINNGNLIIGNGNVTSQEVNVSGFDSVDLNGVADITIHPSEDYKVIVTTDSNIQDNVVITSKNNSLYISSKNDKFTTKELTIDIYMPNLKSVRLKGVGNLKISKGKATDLEIIQKGVGDIDTQDYEVENVNITLSGTGNIKTWATKTLTGKLSGLGDVLYKGNPFVKVDINGVGDVRKIQGIN